MSVPSAFLLQASDIPTHWYNLNADMPEPMAPPLHPGTKQPVCLEDMLPIFPEVLVQQEMSQERWIEIPEPVRDIYAAWRPAPLYRAVRLEKALDTPAHIYYKYEGVSPAGSHKPNTAVAQAYYNKISGIKRLATETGAGQWGSSLAMACQMFGLECTVYMVKVSFTQKPYRKSMMGAWGANVFASPSENTAYGRKVLAESPDCPGSLGIAISEAIEDTVSTPGTEMAGEMPDVVLGCAGGGSNFAGISVPFMYKKLTEGMPVRIVAVEPSSCPSLTKGELRYDFGDTAGMTPLMMMYTLGHDFMPPSIHSGGLRYHGMAPMVSHLYKLGLIEAVSAPQTAIFEAAVTFARSEGIIPAPESSHAIRAAIDEALAAKAEGKQRNILFNLSGNGYLDLAAYDSYLAGSMKG
ncbi:MAG: TrpB-like pyridoxal phosphate-dependent enzyme [Armatimonadetes bacterium]|nr:TrpB-like pyridoxal phosphate-dependent enzyme [Armatimonadota bacterium]